MIDNLDALHAIETDLEIRSIDEGIARYRLQRASSDPSSMGPEMSFICQGMETLVPAISEAQDGARSGLVSKGVTLWGLPLLSLDAEKLALLTLVTMFNCSSDPGTTFFRTALDVAAAVKNERDFEILKKTNRDLFKQMSHYIKAWTPEKIKTFRKKAAAVDLDWPRNVRGAVGAKLMELAITCTDLFDYSQRYVQGQLESRVVLRDDILQEIERRHSDLEILRPAFLPMVVPPGDWGPGVRGGYKHHVTSLVKGRNQVDPGHEMPNVYRALNYVQRSPFRINEYILGVASKLWEMGGGMAGLPPIERLPLPARPLDIDTNEEARKRWRTEAAKQYDKDVKLRSKRKASIYEIDAGRRFSKFSRIYFPWRFDYRSRMYPDPMHLHPQADDLGRALLEAAEPEPLGSEGLYWLKVHVANCMGHDKVGFDDRVLFADRIAGTEGTAWVDDPIENTGWMSDEYEPFKLLAAMRELVTAIRSGRPEEHLCRTFVAQDGSCNGLQHLNAMIRNRDGAAQVNLLPSDLPASIYRAGAAKVNEIIERDAAAGSVPARNWLGRVTKDTVKRAFMTTPYGLTRQGMRQQFSDDGHCDGVPGEINENLNYLRDVTASVIESMLGPTADLMAWFQKAAAVASEANVPIRWTTPVGFPVLQEQVEQDTRRIYTTLQTLNYREPSKVYKIKAAEQIRGIVPNYTHSIDASHLIMVLNRLEDAGILCVLPVHDSYGVLPNRVPTLRRILLEEFVALHKQPLLARFRDSLIEQLPDDFKSKVPPLPEPGDLDLDDVLGSLFAFH